MYIKNFADIKKEDIGIAGGKGANLGELTGAGIPVPGGGVLTVQAYERFMEENQVPLDVDAAKIRDAILNGHMPEDVRQEIIAFYETLGETRGADARVAVRSSATMEDLADASFAGQQETYLNIRGTEKLLESIKACYASLWGDRAVSYRREKGYDGTQAALAVVIQRMVESETAGVLFTQNPANGNKDELLINASYGLGESVVSGTVTPDELTCRRDGTIEKQIVGSKERMVIYAAQATASVPVKEEDRGRCCLTVPQVKELVEAGIRIEEHYGIPMDVEWAFAEGKLYILQARAITAKAEQGSVEIQGIRPPEIQPVNQKMRQSLLFMLEKEPMTYYPLDYDFSMLLGRQKAKIFAEAGLVIDNECGMDENGFMMLPTDKFHVGKNILHLPGMISAMGKHAENVRLAKAALAQSKPIVQELEKADIEGYGLEKCLETLTSLYRLIGESAYARFRYAVFPGFFMNRKLDKYLKKAGEGVNAYNLLAGLSYKTADMNYALLKLADTIMKDPEAKEAILSGRHYEELVSRFPEVKISFEEFLKEYGNKSDFNCYCYAARTWNEDKERFLQVFRPLLVGDRGKEVSPEEGKADYEALIRKMTAGISQKKKKEVTQLAEYYRFYHAYREETQYLWETVFYICRRLLARSAELLGVTAETLQYLFWDELQVVMKRGRFEPDELALIRKRKELRPVAEEYWKKQQWEALKGEGDTLKGVSGSAGEASGEVCVITAPDEFGKLKKGDILVCRYTDPEWTPLFTLAAAVVADTGGVLSHAAIVAREYHIPAVLAVGCATASLKDGDRVFVNGTTGEVRCL